jgi:hypothetical protein
MKDFFETIAFILAVLLIGPISILCAVIGKIPLSVINGKWKDIPLDTTVKKILVVILGLIIWGMAIMVMWLVLCALFPSLPVCHVNPTSTVTGTLTPTLTLTPTSTITLTPPLTSTTSFTPTPTLSPTVTLAPTLTSEIVVNCPYQGINDNQTIINLIQMEAVASNTKDMSIIQSIFSSDAVFHDYSTEPSKTWIGPKVRYQDDLFRNTDLQKVEHFDILPAGNGIVGDRATYTSGSKGEYRAGDTYVPFINGSSKTTKYGSDHWILGKNDQGCWVIEELDINAGHVQFP